MTATCKCQICHLDIVRGDSASGWVHSARNYEPWFGSRADMQRQLKLAAFAAVSARVSRKMDADHAAEPKKPA